MRYVNARWKDKQRECAYRIYVSDTLYWQNHGKAVDVRYVDIITPKKQDTRTGDEIVADVINKLGLVVTHDERI